MLLLGCGSQPTSSTQAQTGQTEQTDSSTPVNAETDWEKLKPRPLSVVMPELNQIVNQRSSDTKPFTGEVCIEGLRSAEMARNDTILLAIANRCHKTTLSPKQAELYYLVYQRSLHKSKQWRQSIEAFEENDYLQKHIFFSERAKAQLTIMESYSLEQLGSYWYAAQNRASLAGKPKNRNDKRLSDEEKQLLNSNDTALWNDILRLSHNDIVRHIRSTPRSLLLSWLELAEIIKNPVASTEEQLAAIELWKETWQSLNILGNWYPPDNIEDISASVEEKISELAVVIPLSGSLRMAGQAVQSGIISASIDAQNSGHRAPKLTFYDSETALFDTLYQRAVADGADAIIGPLQKQQVEQLHTSITDIPVLALNYVADTLPPPPNVIQFGLAAEDEAKQLARFAGDAQLNSILVLNTGRDWAKRAANTFSRHWRENGGETLNKQLSVEANYQKEIADALAIASSEQRKSQLQGLMGRQFEFKARRRQDIDAVVVFSTAKQLAAIKPLLAYHYAGDVPVLSSSRAHSFSEKNNRDLAGVLFVDAPILLEKNRFFDKLNRPLQENYQLSRLYAMGIDAYRIAPKLPIMIALKQEHREGLTGSLLLENQRLTRKLNGAVMSRRNNRVMTKKQLVDALR